jgi:hypothetical protein
MEEMDERTGNISPAWIVCTPKVEGLKPAPLIAVNVKCLR